MDSEELEGVKFSEFPSATPSNSDEVVGLHSGNNARFSIANIVAAVRNGLASIFVPLTRTINGKGLSTDITLDSSDIDYDNTGSGLTATDIQEAIDELAQGGTGGSAANVTYDSTTSGLTATNVQDAVDEVVDDLDGKANQAQLAYVESGTMATKTGGYTAGEYICWQGTLYTANTNIAYGTTLSAGTGGNLTECVGGGFNNQLKVKEFTFTTATLGTSFGPTSRRINTTQNLFGIDATRICSMQMRDNTLAPSSNIILGLWNGGLWIAATQNCTLSDTYPVKIVVTYY